MGLNDNFFEVGGHSLLAIQITSRVQAELGLEVPLVEVFQTETLRAYAGQGLRRQRGRFRRPS